MAHEALHLTYKMNVLNLTTPQHTQLDAFAFFGKAPAATHPFLAHFGPFFVNSYACKDVLGEDKKRTVPVD